MSASLTWISAEEDSREWTAIPERALRYCCVCRFFILAQPRNTEKLVQGNETFAFFYSEIPSETFATLLPLKRNYPNDFRGEVVVTRNTLWTR